MSMDIFNEENKSKLIKSLGIQFLIKTLFQTITLKGILGVPKNYFFLHKWRDNFFYFFVVAFSVKF